MIFVLNIGDVIRLETLTDDRISFKCKVVEKIGNQLFVDYPINISTGRTAYLMIGTELSAFFVSSDQNAYRFKTVVTGRVKENIPMMELAYPGDDSIVRIQRREFVRIKTTLDVAIHPLINEFEPFVAITADLSAGGAAVILPKSIRLQQGQKLILWLTLPFPKETIEYIKLNAKIIRFIPMENDSFLKVPLQFLDIEEATRQTLIRYCFNQQLQMRRKELITE